MSEQKGHPDADLYPEATGLAKQTVDAHAAEQSLKLYAGWFCPFVQRVWIVLQEKNIPYQYIEVNPYHKPSSLLRLNPRGLVPTLQYLSKPLYESTVICEFLDDLYPNPPLFPSDKYEKARTKIWIDFVTSRIIPAFHRFLQYQTKEDDHAGEGLKKVRHEFVEYIIQFVREMDSNGPYFCGKEPTLVDFVIAPWMLRLWIFDHFKGGSGIPVATQGGPDEPIWSRLRKWHSAMENRQSVKDTTSDREHLLPIYKKYADDVAMSELAKATRAGRGVP